jgi:hypothetical protein
MNPAASPRADASSAARTTATFSWDTAYSSFPGGAFGDRAGLWDIAG